MILCANTRPALNDVIYSELLIIVKRVAEICSEIQAAYRDGTLMIMESGQGSPCLDLRYIIKYINEKYFNTCMSTKNIVVNGMS